LALDFDVYNRNLISSLRGKWVVFVLVIGLDGVTRWKGIGQRINFLQSRSAADASSLRELTMLQCCRQDIEYAG
jgi:hypothetical protein